MPDRFYIWEDEERHGPYSETQIERMLEDRIVSFSHECENVATGEVVALDELFEPADDAGEAEEEGEWEDGEDEVEEEWEEEEWEEVEEEEEYEEEDPDDSPPPSSILFQGHPTFFKYGGALALMALGVGFGLWLGPRDIWYFIGGFGIATITLMAVVIDRSTRIYIVTPKRVELIWGLFARSSREVRIEDIRTINVKREGISGLLGIGTVEFSSTGDAIDVEFTDLWAAQRVKALVRELQDEME